MIAHHQITSFKEKGLIRLKGFLPAERVARARNEILRRLEQGGLWKDNVWYLDKLPPSPVPMGVSKLLGRMSKVGVFGEMITSELVELIEVLLDGRPLYAPKANGQVLFTAPNATYWTLPAGNWHLDVSRLPGFSIPGVQVFAFLNHVVQGGGGTLVVAGSHMLFNGDTRISSKQVRQRLKRYSYFRDLMNEQLTDRHRFMDQPGRVDDIELQVVELFGQAGDVFLMDMRLLHAPAPNAAEVPRMMLTKRFFLEAAYIEMYGSLKG